MYASCTRNGNLANCLLNLVLRSTRMMHALPLPHQRTQMPFVFSRSGERTRPILRIVPVLFRFEQDFLQVRSRLVRFFDNEPAIRREPLECLFRDKRKRHTERTRRFLRFISNFFRHLNMYHCCVGCSHISKVYLVDTTCQVRETTTWKQVCLIDIFGTWVNRF